MTLTPRPLTPWPPLPPAPIPRERGNRRHPSPVAAGRGGGAPLPVGWERVGEGSGVRGSRAGGACFVLLILLTLFASVSSAQETVTLQTGQVELPLDVYNRLIDTARDPSQPPRPAPAGFALGRAQVDVTVAAEKAAEIRVELKIQVLEDDWVLIPVLPAGTAVASVAVGGSEVQLLTTPAGLAWSSRQAGSYDMTLAYRVDATRSDAGSSLAVPLPAAAAITLNATLPGTGLDVAVIPSAGTRVTTSGDATRVAATLPTTRGAQISWRPPAKTGHAMSRARYSGQLAGDAVTWTGVYNLELMSDETLTLPLLPRKVTLSQLQVDGEDAAILVDGDRFATVVRGRGLHTVTVDFEVPVTRRDGPPRIELEVPLVPVSRFELTLPGKKEVTVTPLDKGGKVNVVAASRGGNTVATAHVPLTGQVAISWAEAVPEEIRAETRINAGLYHAAWAEEGVLYVRALADFEVSRGETNALRLEVPPEVMVNRVSAESGAVADWRLSGPDGGPRELTVFLDRQLRERLVLEVLYDRSLGESDEIMMPLLRSVDAQRQRGMVALLSGQDLALQPVTDEAATRVGENQLPAFVRQAVELTVAHTYKYVETPPELTVHAAAPEREEGRFDTRIDTLISLGEVTLKGSASVEVVVKSGRISALELELPAGVNLLSLTGPSVRDHSLSDLEDNQRIDVEFTQEMEGEFRLEVAYERILGDGDAELEVPALAVPGAEVEQGRIAVEALSAVEVQPAVEEQLTALEISELPQQLILRTTNPILMAYKYVSPPYRLALEVTRHQVVAVQEAAIDRADYRTLFTRDGLAVTTARFQVRNSRQQFLRVKLPAGSEIWSAFVDGRPQKPARTEADGEVWHLIKIIHSTQGFPVELVFQTPDRPIRSLGTVAGELPRPEILVTHSRWDVYVPADVRYGEPRGGMELVTAATPVSSSDLDAEMARLQAGGQVIEPLRLVVPTAGLHFAFEKLYANQSDDAVGFEIPYASGLGSTFGNFLSLLSGGLIWLGIAFFFRRKTRLAAGLAATGLLLLALLVGRYQISAGPAVWLSVLIVLGIGAYFGKAWWEHLREEAEPEAV